MSSERRSISGASELFQRAEERQKQLCYATFSDYIQALIRADVLREQSGSAIHDAAPPAFDPRNSPESVTYKIQRKKP